MGMVVVAVISLQLREPFPRQQLAMLWSTDGAPGRELFAILHRKPYGLEIALSEPGGPDLVQSGF